jgi:hypothetical protein
MTDKKKKMDRERVKHKREQETSEERRARLDKVKAYKKSEAGKKVISKANAKYNAK